MLRAISADNLNIFIQTISITAAHADFAALKGNWSCSWETRVTRTSNRTHTSCTPCTPYTPRRPCHVECFAGSAAVGLAVGAAAVGAGVVTMAGLTWLALECDYFAVIANIVVAAAAAAAVAPVAVELASSSPPPAILRATENNRNTKLFCSRNAKMFRSAVVVVVSAVIADALVAGIWRYVYATYVGSPFAFVCTLLLQGSSSLHLLSALSLSLSLLLSVIALNVIIASFDFVSLFFPSSSALLAAAVIVFAWLRCVAQVY